VAFAATTTRTARALKKLTISWKSLTIFYLL